MIVRIYHIRFSYLLYTHTCHGIKSIPCMTTVQVKAGVLHPYVMLNHAESNKEVSVVCSVQ
jgi:hypothetical protein